VGVDLRRMASMRAFDEPSLGIRESFVQPSIGGGRTVGVVSTPTQTTPSMGWVICHSFALEHTFLQPFETSLARRLAGSGVAVMRFHAQGYGDSEFGAETISVHSHVQNAMDAAGVLAETMSLDRVGFLGLRLGGTIAALAADGSRAAGLMAIAPVVRGGPYIRATIRQVKLTELAMGEQFEKDPPSPSVSSDITDVGGFPLRQEVVDEFASVDVAEGLRSFRGASLVLQVSRSPKPEQDIQRLVATLQRLGGTCDLEVLAHPTAPKFGLPRLHSSRRGYKEDTQSELAEAMETRVLAWSAGQESTRTEALH